MKDRKEHAVTTLEILRTGPLGGLAASVSLPLDVGAATETIPTHLRRAVIARAARPS